MGQYKVYSEEEKRWITLPMAFQGEQGVKGEPGDDGVTPMLKIVSGMWNISYDNGRTWGEVGPANGTSINDVQAIVDSSTGTPSATASYSGPDNARTLTFRFSGLKGEQGPKGDQGPKGADGAVYEYVYFRGMTESHKPKNKPVSVNQDKYRPTEVETVTYGGKTYDLNWSISARGIDSLYKYEWRSEREKINGVWGEYSDPILVSRYGEDGSHGTGGNRFEYIYTRRKDKSVDVFPPTSKNEDGHIPSDDEYSWTRTPQGVSAEWEIEYVFFREKDLQTNIWGDWKDQGIWSEYGKVGRDGNGLEYIFKLTKSLEDKPDKPVAPSNTAPESYPDTWSDNPLAVSENMQCCWVSIRNQYYDEDGIQKWGAYSDPSPWAMYGKAGADGGRTVLMFIGTEEYATTCPKALPIGGTWDIKTNSIIFNGNDTANGWTMSTPARTDKTRFVWQTYADFNGEGLKVTDWQSAICITGENGAAGADGLSREYIYLLLPDKDVYGLLLDIYNDAGENNWLKNTDTGVVPDPIEIGGIMYTWTDNPSGIDDVNNLVEVVCTRIHEENGWSNWSKPTYWAMWGEDGNDGPGVEYIFRVTSPINPNSEQPHMKTREAFAEFLHNELISWREAIGDTEYQKDEVYPSKFNLENYGYEIDWEDEPQDVDENQPLEWVSIRKKVDGVWQPYSMPKVWNVYAKDGISYKTFYVFTRSNETPVVPNGGSYDDPYPSNTINGERIWDDTVPSGTGIIWMSYRTFSNPDTDIDDDWSTPVKMSDTSTFQVEFTAQDIAEKLQSGYKPARIEVAVFDDAAENAWRESESAKGVTWDDDVVDAVYMIMSTCYNGVWSDWTIIRIKGEKGDRGDDGTSVKIEGFFETVAQLQNEWNIHIDTDPDTHTTKFVLPLENGDGYIINETGDLWVHSRVENDTFESNWTNVGQIKGPDGETSVVLFKTTTDNDAPSIPTGNTIESAKGWTRLAVSADINNPFIWYVVAKVVKDTVIEWSGDKDNPGKAALFTRYVYDGNHAMHLELTDDVGDVPVENGTVDPEFIEKNEHIQTELILYYGDAVVQSNDDYPIVYSYSYIDAEGNTQTIAQSEQIFTLPLKDASGNARKVEDMPKSVLCTATYKGVPYKRTFHLRYSESPYKIEVSKTVLEKYPSDHENAGYLVDSDKTVTVTVRKWLENTWTEIDGKNVFARCYHSGSTYFDVKNIDLSNTVKFDFSEEKDLTSIMIYVTDDNTNDGNMLSWQDIGVVKNGADGSKGDPGQPGLSITYKGSMTESEFGNAWAEYLANSPNDIQDVNIGDSYYITDKGTMRICHTIVNRDSCIDCEDCCGWEQYWSETQWTGTPADVLYVRYSNDKESFTDANGTVPGKYIGIITKSADYTPKFEDFKDLWTKWTGEDGFGQEQIFLLTDNTFDGSEGKKLPAPDNGDGSPNYYPEVDIDIANNVKGYTTTLDNVEKTIWFDHPQTPTKDYPYCWVAFRQYDHSTGKYGSWKTAVYTNYAFDGSPGAAGESMITSYVFRWYAATTDKPSPDAPTGGSFKTPLPDESDWSDTITENSDRVSTLWMSMRTFKSNDDNYQQGWSTPRRVADTSDFQFEFTKTDLSQFANYTPSIFTGDEQAWRTYEKDRGVEWLDQEKDALYMATAVCHNGIWADWKVTKIKGEKGDPGDPGSSVKFSGEFDTLQSLKQEWESYCAYMKNPIGSIPFDGTLSQGNGYYVKEDGKLYIYSGGWSVGENPEFNYYWTGVQFKGNDGVNGSILYVRYSNGKENDKWEFTSADGFDLGMAPGKYIGIYVYVPATDESDLSDDPSVYTWTLWKGEDGWGYEQVFVLAKAGKTPTIPISQNPYKDECPEIRDEDKDVVMGNNGNWSDIPMTPTQDYPTCYGIMRKVHGSEFGTWEGPFVYSIFSYDGKFEHFIVHNTMDQIYVGADNKTVVDQTFKTKVSINTQNGELPISAQNNDFTITGLKNITHKFNSETSEILFTIPKDTLVNTDIEIGIEYNDKTKTMLLKRIVGFTEYSLGTDAIILSENSRPKIYIVENVIGSGQSSKWENDIPVGYRVTWKIDGLYNELVDVLESPSIIREGTTQTASLWKGPTLVDQITFVVGNKDQVNFIVNNPIDQVYFSKYRFRSDLSKDYSSWGFHIQKFVNGSHSSIKSAELISAKIEAKNNSGESISDLTEDLGKTTDHIGYYIPRNWFIDHWYARIINNNNLYIDLYHNENYAFFDNLLKGYIEKVDKIIFELTWNIDGERYTSKFTIVVLPEDDDYDIVCKGSIAGDTPTFNVTKTLENKNDVVYADNYMDNTLGIYMQISKRSLSGYDLFEKVPTGFALTISEKININPSYSKSKNEYFKVYLENDKIEYFKPGENREYYIQLFKKDAQVTNTNGFGQTAIQWTLIDQITIYPQRIEYDLKLDNTFAIVHLNPDDTIAEGQTITSGIKLFRAGVIQNIVEYPTDTNVGVNVVCDGNITHELDLDSGVLTLNPTKNKKLENKVVTVEYYDKLGDTSYKVASATITLDVDRPFVDYDLSTSVKTITKKSDGTFNPSSFGVSILQKAVGSENILTEYHNVPNGYRVEYGTSGVIHATEQLTEIIPDDNITDNIIPVKLIKTGPDGQDSIVVDRIDVAVIETSGKRGQMLYPAGVWDANKTYYATDNAAPYVEYIDASGVNQGYYILTNEGTDGVTFNTPDQSNEWKKADGNFDTIFSKAIVAQYGNIGGAVYYSHTTSDNNTYEFLFSKSGKENDTIESAEYSDFMIDVETDDKGANKVVDWTGEQKLLDVILERSRFIPNTLICFTTGEAWYSGGSTKFYGDSSTVAGIEYVDELVHYYPESITLVLDQESTDGGAIELTFEDGMFDADGKYRYHDVKSNSDSYINVHGHNKGAQEWNNSSNSISFRNLVLICDVSEIKNEPGEILFSEAFVSYQSDNRTFETPKCYIRYVENDNTDNGIDYSTCDYITLPLKWADEQNISGTKDVKFQSLYKRGSETSGDMHVAGDLTVNKTLYYQDIQELSDERKKTFENSINVDFDKLASLRKSYFTYNDKPSVQKIGVSAQEIQRLYPEIVGTDPRGYLGVDYSKLSVIALKAIDQLHERVKYLEGVIESLSK